MPADLQRQMSLWPGVLPVTLSLLTRHQMSENHIAAEPTQPAGVLSTRTATRRRALQHGGEVATLNTRLKMAGPAITIPAGAATPGRDGVSSRRWR